MRVYGALKGPEPAPEEAPPATTPDALPGQDITALISELRALREEVAGLRQTMKLIEYKPDPPPTPEPPTEAVAAPGVARVGWWSALLSKLRP